MRIVVDTNIVFSAILTANSRISNILFQQTSELSFCATKQLLVEIERHRSKLLKLSSYSDAELSRIITIIKRRIKFISVQSIPESVYQQAELLTGDIDPDDTEFVALTEYLNTKLWTGDKALIAGLTQKGWNKFILTAELYEILLNGG